MEHYTALVQCPRDGAPAAGHGVAGEEGRGWHGPVAAAGPQVAPGAPVPLQGRAGDRAGQGGQAGGELRRYLDMSRYIYIDISTHRVHTGEVHHAQHWARPGGAGAGQLPGDVRRLPRLLGPGADMSIHIYRYLLSTHL